MATGKRVFLIEADQASRRLCLLRLLSAAFVLLTSPVQAQPVDPTGIVQSFLPQEAELRTAESADLNGDQIPEIVASYKLPSEQEIIVLQQKGPEEFTLTVTVMDLTGDGQSELVLDWITGYMSAGNDLDVYGWKEGTMKKLATTGYHQLEWLPPKQGKRALAVWQKDTGLAFMVKTLRLGEQGWVNADEQYPEYFREVVVPYDQQLVEQLPGALAWCYLAEAQVKARMPQEALESIEKGLSINEIDYPLTYKFEQLKEQALLQLKH